MDRTIVKSVKLQNNSPGFFLSDIERLNSSTNTTVSQKPALGQF